MEPDHVPPPPPVIGDEAFLRLDLLEMTNIPRYWTSVLSLGTGAFGEIHLVHSDQLDARGENIIHNEFVLKIVKLPSSELVNVVREVEMHRLCRNHQNVLFAGVSYCQQYGDGYRVQMCLEYAALSDMGLFSIKEKEERHIAFVCKQVINALQHIHTLRVVHGDLSIRNVLTTHRGVIKISDFGMADTLENTTRRGQVTYRGTPGFIAPEVISMTGYDTRADMWSLGILALFLSTGKNPFQQGILFDFQTYRRLIAEEFYPDLDPLNLSDDFYSFITDLNHYDPAERCDAWEISTDNFIKTSCTQQEFLDHYKQVRTRYGMDLPFPDDSQPFSVPTVRE
ncbi:hypothetical protein GCK72_024569 [Caenorhabditis remanei]|uniref:Protein kinase domain-containing protein n=1 Tax=Caenorhabditis remanei TaxID=31234 RepID=A0A6A5G094_CAERE|nr:hypothetical protein GCK72_024569 [Caenorhabditis remanei]KAF1748102.1 hypothetical protein GCK72_024569 [Caenorhabditis remanei]